MLSLRKFGGNYYVELPFKHKWASLKPFIGEIDIEEYLAAGQNPAVTVAFWERDTYNKGKERNET